MTEFQIEAKIKFMHSIDLAFISSIKKHWSWTEKSISCQHICIFQCNASNFCLFAWLKTMKWNCLVLLIELSLELAAVGCRWHSKEATMLFYMMSFMFFQASLHFNVHHIELTFGHYFYCFGIRKETIHYNVWWPSHGTEEK